VIDADMSRASLLAELGDIAKTASLYMACQDMTEVHVPADGNCQFNAFILASEGEPCATADALRAAVVCHLETSDEWTLFLELDGTLEEGKAAYLENMRRRRVWGDNFTLQAMSELGNTRVVVRHLNGTITVLGPDESAASATVFLKFDSQRKHYSALSSLD